MGESLSNSLLRVKVCTGEAVERHLLFRYTFTQLSYKEHAMSLDTVKRYFSSLDALDKVIELTESSATVELAAAALSCLPAHIAKTMSFDANGKTVLVVCAGDAKVDNRKFKKAFETKARMIQFNEVEQRVGHAPGGVCPFAVNEGVEIFLDSSLRRFETVYPAAGNGASAVKLSIPELERFSQSRGWVDVCKGWEI